MLSAGTRLGSYVIRDPLGHGGMGEVYGPRDERIDREVAVKVLPADVAGDREHRERFAREARILGSLNHPHIAAIYEYIEQPEHSFIAMELVEGITLAERIGQGAVPVKEALTVAHHVTLALEAAHAKGIIHRDIKPGNVKLTPSGEAKVLDFGLAHRQVAIGSRDSTQVMITQVGTRLGTSAYMSPEQVRAEATNQRTDIWSFGCLLFECLSGHQAFTGTTTGQLHEAILVEEPNWDRLPKNTPPQAAWLLQRCLTKDQDKRLHDIADARIELESALENERTIWRTMLRRKQRSAVLTALLITAAVIAATAVWLGRCAAPRPATPAARALHVSIGLPWAQRHVEFDLSPDGELLVFEADPGALDQQVPNAPQLWTRKLDSFDATPILDTSDARFPRFSPDGQWIAFLVSRSGGEPDDADLNLVSLRGDTALTLADNALDHVPYAWLSNDSLVYVDSADAWRLWRVRTDGTRPTEVFELERSGQLQSGVISLSVLPDPDWVAVTQRVYSAGSTTITRLVDLAAGAVHPWLDEGGFPHFIDDRHMLFMRTDTLLLGSIDLAADPKRFNGVIEPVTSGLPTSERRARDAFAFSASGHLATAPEGPAARRRLSAVDDAGAIERLNDTAYPDIAMLALAQDGSTLAVRIGEDARDAQVWTVDLASGLMGLASPKGTSCYDAAWHPDGRLIVVAMMEDGRSQFLAVAPEPHATPEVLFAEAAQPEGVVVTPSVSADGNILTYCQYLGNDTHNGDLWGQRMDHPEATPRRLTTTDSDECSGVLSPAGQWLAYESNLNGRFEVYVAELTAALALESVEQVSGAGGRFPLWSANGETLYFKAKDKGLYAAHPTAKGPSTDALRSILAIPELNAVTRPRTFAALPDGRLLFVRMDTGSDRIMRLDLYFDWWPEVRQRIASRD